MLIMMASRRCFSESVVSTLKAYYAKGLVGVGKKYSGLISAAAQETGLTEDQVKVRSSFFLISL